MSLKEFKKVGSNDKFTTFKHSNGSWLKVAHKSLKPEYRKKLAELPTHPEAMGINSSNTKSLSGIAPLYQEQGGRTDFSNVNNMADGGDIAPPDSDVFTNNRRAINHRIYGKPQDPDENVPDDEFTGDDMENLHRGMPLESGTPPIDISPVKSEDIKNFASGGDVAQDVADSRAKLGLTKYSNIIDSAPVPADQASNTNIGVVGPPSPLATPVTDDSALSRMPDVPSPAQNNYSIPSGMSDLDQGFQTQLQGVQEQQKGAEATAAVKGALGAQGADSLASAINQRNTLNNSFTKHYQDLQNERDMQAKEVLSGAAHLDPNRYIKNMSTGGKILTGIGLILGGAGSGLSRQPNIAANFLQNQINADIENQRKELGVKQNLLTYNLEKSKDLRDATSFSAMQTNDMLALHLQQQAMQAQNPLQQAELLNQSGILKQKAGEIQNQIAQRRAFMQIGAGASGGSNESEQRFQQQNNMLRMMGEQGAALAKSREGKHVPGSGEASREVPPDVLGQISSRQELDKQIEDLQNFASQNSGSLNPATIAQGKAKAALVQDSVRRANQQGVFKESEKDFVNSFIGEDPTQIFQKYRSGKGYAEARRNNLSALNAIKQSYGLPISQQQSAGAQGTPNIQKRGKSTYMKVPGGWKKVK